MSPFVLLGKWWGYMFPLKSEHNIFLFFPSADIGGAPKVNTDIARCVKDKNPLIIFSKKPINNQFKELFNIEGVEILDLYPYLDRKLLHFVNFFFRGVIASWINRAKDPVVFGGESLFFYKIIPHINKNIPCIELCHLPTWFPYTIGFIDRINERIFSTNKLKEDVIRLYDKNHIDPLLYKRLYFVDNAVAIPAYKETNNPRLEVVFIGRGAPQKRVHLVAAIARKMQEANDNIHFSFVGDVENIIETSKYPYCRFYGNVSDTALMEKIYRESDVLILTSASEGLPIVVMTMMAYGKIVISTAVNGIPDYITHMKNGLLISVTGENKIVEQGVDLLRLLIKDPELKTRLGKNNRQIAQEKFSQEVFCRKYREILLRELQLPK
jgi:L-malate glycosyltransferase